jgi:hypothetical protein
MKTPVMRGSQIQNHKLDNDEPARFIRYVALGSIIPNYPFLCPPDHKLSAALCHGLCVSVSKHLVSVNYRTSACGLLGVTRGRFLSMISAAAHP